MQNVKITRKGNICTIEFDVTKDFGPSKSGKTNVVATTSGFTGVPDDASQFSLNVIRRQQ